MKNLAKAFRGLRKAGYYAKQNYWCCQSCAWADVPKDKENKVVFYHKQDGQSLKADGSCYLAWNGNANEIIEILNSSGVKAEWSGDKNTRIKIYAFDKE